MANMSPEFVAYFTMRGAWRSCDVTELGSYTTELAAMRALQRHASQHPYRAAHEPSRLVWKRLPQGLAAPMAFGRYDIRQAEAGKKV